MKSQDTCEKSLLEKAELPFVQLKHVVQQWLNDLQHNKNITKFTIKEIT